MQVQRLDNALSWHFHKQIYEFLYAPGWQFGWKSSPKKDLFSFWHKHFAGSTKSDHQGAEQYDCADELAKIAPLLHGFWQQISEKLLLNHTLVRCYANAHTYGSDGTLHTDSVAPNSFTTIYYPCRQWSPNWGGETVFFNQAEDDIIGCIYPKPNRLFTFPGTMPHVARGVSRSCPILRVTLMFKTNKWSPPDTKPS